MPTLYEKLQTAENVNIYLKGARNRYIDLMRAFEDAPGIVAIAKTLPDEPLQEISVPDYQRQIIESSTSNPVLLRALQGKQTVEQRLEEIYYRHNRNVWEFLPKRRDEQHNNDVDELSALVGRVDSLKTKSLFQPFDNSVAYPFYVACAIFPVASIGDQHERGVLYGFSAGFISLISVIITALRRENSKIAFNGARKEAHYIDTKIAELYPRKTSIVVPSEKQVVVEEL